MAFLYFLYLCLLAVVVVVVATVVKCNQSYLCVNLYSVVTEDSELRKMAPWTSIYIARKLFGDGGTIFAIWAPLYTDEIKKESFQAEVDLKREERLKKKEKNKVKETEGKWERGEAIQIKQYKQKEEESKWMCAGRWRGEKRTWYFRREREKFGGALGNKQ